MQADLRNARDTTGKSIESTPAACGGAPLRLRPDGLRQVDTSAQFEFDLIVIGSGAGGLTTAVTAAAAGLRTLVVEKAEYYGGSSAMSGGALWLPCSSLARRAGIEDSLSDVREYLSHCAPAVSGTARLEAFLQHGPAMLEFLSSHTPVRFGLGRHVSDYHTDFPGARVVGRCVVAGSLDARGFGETLKRLAPPLPATTLAGLPLEQGRTVIQALGGNWEWSSLRLAARLLYRSYVDRGRYGRLARLRGGQAMTVGLMHGALASGAEVWLDAPVERVTCDVEGKVAGVVVRTRAGALAVRARVGVVIATGGFAHDPELKGEFYSHAAAGAAHASVAVPTAVGEGIRLGLDAGAALQAAPHSGAAWIPVSAVPLGGATHFYPHFADRAKPGVIAVDPRGRRFVNEASSYHEFVGAMIENCRGQADVTAWLIADASAVKRYGLGFARPWPWPIEHCVRSGYLVRAGSLEELAQRIGVDGATLKREVEQFNADARLGRDTRFGKGSTDYNRRMGDLRRDGNPCLAPLERAPFYAVRLIPGDLGTFSGLRTDEHARVLRPDGAPIPGLYAVGADATNPLGGAYPGAGSTLGPIGMFAYVCARHEAAAARSST